MSQSPCPSLDPFQLPKWRCHKVVQAAKIMSIVVDPDRDRHSVCVYSPGGGLVIPVTAEWMQKHHPAPEGYFVRYEDGYESYSPEKAFEDGYTQLPMTPGDASDLAGAMGWDRIPDYCSSVYAPAKDGAA